MKITGEHKQEVLILTGLPASGKTQYANEWLLEDPEHRRRINYDDLRLVLYGPNWVFNRAEEEEMKQLALSHAKLHLAAGESVVIDNTHLTDRSRASWIALAKQHGIVAEVHEVEASVSTCIERDKKREKRVGRAVIERMALFHGFFDWNDPYLYPRLAHPERDFVICDIDGTLADGKHREHWIKVNWCYHCQISVAPILLGDGRKGACPTCRGPIRYNKDWNAFHEHVDKDSVIQPIADLVRLLHTAGYYIIIVSGRWSDKGCGIKTEGWLDKHGVPYHHLFMRNGGDSREDSVIKREILELLPKERIAWVLDDRDRVVQMWRQQELTCLQVAEGAF